MTMRIEALKYCENCINSWIRQNIIDSKSIDSDKNAFSSDADNSDFRQLAVMIVDNLLTRAVSKASEHIFNCKELRNHKTPEYNRLDLDSLPPAIQIDLVGSRSPSPEDELQIDWSVSKKQYRFRAPVDQQSTSMDTDISINDFELSERENESICKDSNFDNKSTKSINFDEMKDFVKEYVENVIRLAIEKFNTESDKSVLKTSLSDNHCFDSCTISWMDRIRQVIRQLMRSTCLCKNKQQFRHRKS